jgi:hypothetical protein
MIRTATVAVLLIGLCVSTGLAAGPERRQTPEELAARIDHWIGQRWQAEKVQPAPLAGDAEFLRRIYLELVGRIPSVTEVRDFLKDQAPDKRRRVIRQLLASHGHVNHSVNVWSSWLLPEQKANADPFAGSGLDAWLRWHLERNTPYDRMVRELLTAPIADSRPARAPQAAPESPPANAFLFAKELKPENLASGTSQLFLGIRLGCAQCHNHPFAKWKRDEFWSFAAFFAGMKRIQPGQGEAYQDTPTLRKLTIPGTERVVEATFLDGAQPKWTKEKDNARLVLAEWVTAKDNPYFARATVNRLWYHFFGTALVEPVDDMVGADTAPSHPELLDELACGFVGSGFDLRFLTEAIVSSRAWQLSSAGGPPDVEPSMFAVMPLRGLTGEQLYDSLTQAVGRPLVRGPGPNSDVLFFFVGDGNDPRTEFLRKFSNASDRPTEVRTSIQQALALMNGRLVADATHLKNSATLAALLDAPFMDTAQRLEVMYLATLSRQPRPEEIERMQKFIDRTVQRPAAPKDDAERENRYQQALADVFWVLLNSSEFYLNH